MKVYIAGKIDGDPSYKYKFNKAEQYLKSLGHIVLNPSIWPQGMSKEDYLTLDMAMLRTSDAAYFLNDYKESAGALPEHQYCEYVGKIILYQESAN